MASVIHATAHGLSAGQAIRFGNIVPTDSGIDETGTYYVLASGLTADDFEFSESPGGTAFVLDHDISAGSVRFGDEYVQDDSIVTAPGTPDAPTGLTLSTSVDLDADGHQLVHVAADLVHSTSDGVSGAVVEATWAAGPGWGSKKTVSLPLGTLRAVFTVPGNVTVYVRAYATNVFGYSSAYTGVSNITSTKDSSAPATPTGLALNGAIQAVVASWTANTELDLDHYDVAVSSDGGSTYPLVLRASLTDLTIGALVAGTYYAKVRAVDTSGNASAYCGAVNATARAVSSGDIGTGAIDSVALFASTIHPPVVVGALPTLPSATYPIGSLVMLTTDGKLYRNVAGAWVKNVAGTDLDAASVSNSALVAHTITAASIAAGTITATEIATDTITAGQIAAGAIGADELAANSVTATKVAANSLDVGHTSVPTGGNLVGNPGFELDGNTSAGDPLTGWLGLTGGAITTNVQTTGLPRSGAYACRIIGPTDGVASARFIPVVPGARYKLRLWGRGDGANIGIGRLQARVHWYDATFVELSSQSQSADLGTGTTFTEIVAQFTAPTTAVYAKVRAQTGSTNDAADKVYADDMEFWRTDSDIDHASGNVLINSSGITINNGALVMQDAFGASSLGASGFSGSWSQYTSLGLYNASFLQGVAGTVPNGRTSALPYWTVSDPDGAAETLTWVAGGSVKMSWGALNKRKRIVSDLIAVNPGRYFEAGCFFDTNLGASTSITVSIIINWFKSDGSASSFSSGGPGISGGGLTTGQIARIGATAPADAAFASFEVEVQETANHSGTAYIQFYTVWLQQTPGQVGDLSAQTVTVAGQLEAVSSLVAGQKRPTSANHSFLGTIASGSATLTLNPVGGALSGNGLIMPWAGKIVGIAIRSTSARTAGTATASATINGTAKTTAQAVLNATNTSAASAVATVAGGADTFAAGDSLRARVVTSGFTPTANAVQVDVYVVFDAVG